MRAEVQRYYGETLKTTDDLKTTACCTPDAPPAHLTAALGRIHPEVLSRYYGCGLVLPEALEGTRVLDLGCGAGRDCYVLAQLVGEAGRVVGVDMTPEQLAVARRYSEHHREAFGYARPNVEFLDGDIERLEALDLPPQSFDLIVSNCVINLASDKAAVLSAAWHLLREGGELYFADIYADRRIPETLKADPVLYGECLSGALYWNDFLRLARASGFPAPRLVDSRPVDVSDPELAARLGPVRFVSATCRLFKIPGPEAYCEDYGHSARYLGSAAHQPDGLSLDRDYRFVTGEPRPVCGNTFSLLAASRLARHFELRAGGAHRGAFEGCGELTPFPAAAPAGPAGCC